MNGYIISEAVLRGKIVAVPSKDITKYSVTAKVRNCMYANPNQIKKEHLKKPVLKVGDFNEEENRAWRAYLEKSKP